jgi:hypothetical protein
MAGLRFTALQTRLTEGLDLTRLTLGEFQPLVPPVAAAFQAHMAQWRFDGPPRTARRYMTDNNCPLPRPEDRLFFILVYVKTYALQVVHGRLFGMGQRTVDQWIHLLSGVLRTTLHALGDAPTRSVRELAHRLGVVEVAAVVVPPSEPPPTAPPPAVAPPPDPASPLVATMAPNGALYAPRTRLHKRAVIAASKKATR